MTITLDYQVMLAVAIEEARMGLDEGGIPIGAALFRRDGLLLGRGHNRRVQENDPSLELNKWYKCEIEYNYTDSTLTYSVDGSIVQKRTAPSPFTFDKLFVMRDNFGAQGHSGYYIDDITVCKRLLL